MLHFSLKRISVQQLTLGGLIKMKVKFINRGLLNMIEPLGIKEEEIKSVKIGESMFIIKLKSGVIATVDYKLDN